MDHEHEDPEEESQSDTNVEEKPSFMPTQEEMDRYIGNI